MDFDPKMFEDLQESELSFDDFAIGCSCNSKIAHTYLHLKIPLSITKCNATGYTCDAGSCPFIYWLKMYWKFKEELFQLLEVEKH